MAYSEETIAKINELLSDDPETKDKVLNKDFEAIRKIGSTDYKTMYLKRIRLIIKGKETDKEKLTEIDKVLDKMEGFEPLYHTLCLEVLDSNNETKKDSKRRII